MNKTTVTGVGRIAASYDDIAKNVAIILRRRHRLSAAEADRAIRMSPLKSVFLEDPEMAAHTSNEAWARTIFSYWQRTTGKE